MYHLGGLRARSSWWFSNVSTTQDLARGRPKLESHRALEFQVEYGLRSHCRRALRIRPPSLGVRCVPLPTGAHRFFLPNYRLLFSLRGRVSSATKWPRPQCINRRRENSLEVSLREGLAAVRIIPLVNGDGELGEGVGETLDAVHVAVPLRSAHQRYQKIACANRPVCASPRRSPISCERPMPLC